MGLSHEEISLVAKALFELQQKSTHHGNDPPPEEAEEDSAEEATPVDA